MRFHENDNLKRSYCMGKKLKFFGIISWVTIIGFSMVACDDSNNDSKSDAKIMTSFSFNITDEEITIDETTKTITVLLLYGADITSITPSITVSEKASYSPTVAQNFTNPVTYTITAENSSIQLYTVKAIVSPFMWTAVSDSTFTNLIRCIAYGGNRFVAVGERGRIAYSDDNGITWTAVSNSTSPSLSSLYSISYGGGRFVAVGDGGKITYSDDGETWIASQTFPYNTFEGGGWGSIAYGGSRFVTGGNNGKMAYSDDGGETWTMVEDSKFPSDSYDGIRVIAYGNGKFIAGGGYKRMAYSSDGVTWTEISITNDNLSPSSIDNISYGGGRFITGSWSNEKQTKIIYSSSDGKNWTESNIMKRISYGGYITYGAGNFIIVSERGRMAYSDDGVTWKEVISNSKLIGDYDNITSIAYGGGRFVAVGGMGNMYGKIEYSNILE
jgi:photosystem II stability/assembly factor-like uncharacterized protein